MFSIVEKEWLQEGKKQAWKNTKAEAIRWVVNINNKLDTWIFVGVTHISAPHQPKIFFLSEDILKFLTHPLVQDPKLHFNVTFMSLPTSFSSTSSPLPSVTSDVIHYIFKLQLSCAPSSTLTLYSWMMKSLMLSVMTNSAIFHGCPSVKSAGWHWLSSKSLSSHPLCLSTWSIQMGCSRLPQRTVTARFHTLEKDLKFVEWVSKELQLLLWSGPQPKGS